MFKRIVFGLLTASLFSACIKSSSNAPVACTYDACAVKAPASEIKDVQDYLTANNITATQHCSGVFYSIDNAGTGTAPTACSGVKATYVGKFTNGNIFDQGTASFGLNQVIKGWTNTIPLLKKGGKIRLYIPPSLGYGDKASGPIPANSILIFDVTLDEVY